MFLLQGNETRRRTDGVFVDGNDDEGFNFMFRKEPLGSNAK